MMREKMTDVVVACPSSAHRDESPGRGGTKCARTSAPSMREIHSSTNEAVVLGHEGSVSVLFLGTVAMWIDIGKCM